MSEWQGLQVGDHITLLSGFPFSSEYFGQEDGVRLIRIRDLVEPDGRTFYRGRYDARWLVQNGDILIGMDGDFNIVRWADGEALLNQRILKVDGKANGLIDRNFFFYWCGPFLKLVHNRTAATTVKHLSVKDIEKANGLFPRKAEQRRIAEILSTLDEAIERTEGLIGKLQQIKAGLMHDLFTRGVTPAGHLRPPRDQAPHLYKHSPLGWIPNEWEAGVLDQFCEIHNNLRKPIASEIREAMRGTYPYYGPTGILDYINEFLVEGEYCLIGEDGDHFLKFAKQPMTLLVTGRFNVNNHAHILTGRNRATTKWLHAFFMHRDITLHLTHQGAGRLKLNKAALRRLPVCVPSPAEQDEILSRIATAQIGPESHGVALQKMRMLKHGLMHDLLTGRVRVPVATASEGGSG